MNVLQFLQPDRLADRIAHFQTLARRGGFMAVQVFTIEDPEYQSFLKNKGGSPEELVVPHGERGYMVRYFQKGELSSYFRGWELIYYHEGLMWDKPHGPQTDFHQHGMAQMIARRKLSDYVI